MANIPLIRQMVAVLYFIFTPGFLILQILRLDNISFPKKLILSVGISLSFMMFTGLLINSLYPAISEPLSLTPLLISLNIIMLGLIILAYKFNKTGFTPSRIFNIKQHLITSRSRSLIIFPILFPLLAVLGTYLMNTQENNLIILLMLFLIPVYMVIVTYLREEIIFNITYPFAVWMIALGLLLMHGLTSYHLMGIDIHNEFYSFKLTLNSLHWSASQYYSSSNSVLSVTILPTTYFILSQLNAEYIFKLVYALIGSFLPLGVYFICDKYLNHKYAFLASLFFIFQVAFIYNLLSSTKTLIALLFFTLSMMLIFEDEIPELPKKILFVLFLISMVVSHYTTSYIMVLLMISVAATLLLRKFIGEPHKKNFLNIKNNLKKIYSKNKGIKEKSNDKELIKKPAARGFTVTSNFFTLGMILLISGLIFLWYSQLTSNAASNTLEFVATTIQNLGNIFMEEVRSPTQIAVIGSEATKIPQMINTIVYNALFATIGLGAIGLLWKYNYRKYHIESEYMVAVLASMAILLAFLIVPYLSKGYGGTRLFTQLAVLLALPFIFGGITLAQLIRRPKLDRLFLLFILFSVFACATYLPYHYLGSPVSPDYDKDGLIRGQTYIYEQDMATAQWLKDHRTDQKLYSDRSGSFVLALTFNEDPYKVSRNTFFSKNQTIERGYIFLRKINLQGPIYGSGDSVYNINDYNNLFTGKSKIYENGGGEVWL